MTLADAIERALWGEWPDPPGDADAWDDIPHPLESHPDQAAIKTYLMDHGWLSFQADWRVGKVGYPVHVLNQRGNLSWCCDPACDRVIVGVPLILFRDAAQGGGTVEFHGDCFNRLSQAGVFPLIVRREA